MAVKCAYYVFVFWYLQAGFLGALSETTANRPKALDSTDTITKTATDDAADMVARMPLGDKVEKLMQQTFDKEILRGTRHGDLSPQEMTKLKGEALFNALKTGGKKIRRTGSIMENNDMVEDYLVAIETAQDENAVQRAKKEAIRVATQHIAVNPNAPPIFEIRILDPTTTDEKLNYERLVKSFEEEDIQKRRELKEDLKDPVKMKLRTNKEVEDYFKEVSQTRRTLLDQQPTSSYYLDDNEKKCYKLRTLLSVEVQVEEKAKNNRHKVEHSMKRVQKRMDPTRTKQYEMGVETFLKRSEDHVHREFATLLARSIKRVFASDDPETAQNRLQRAMKSYHISYMDDAMAYALRDMFPKSKAAEQAEEIDKIFAALEGTNVKLPKKEDLLSRTDIPKTKRPAADEDETKKNKKDEEKPKDEEDKKSVTKGWSTTKIILVAAAVGALALLIIGTLITLYKSYTAQNNFRAIGGKSN